MRGARSGQSLHNAQLQALIQTNLGVSVSVSLAHRLLRKHLKHFRLLVGRRVRSMHLEVCCRQRIITVLRTRWRVTCFAKCNKQVGIPTRLRPAVRGQRLDMNMNPPETPRRATLGEVPCILNPHLRDQMRVISQNETALHRLPAVVCCPRSRAHICANALTRRLRRGEIET